MAATNDIRKVFRSRGVLVSLTWNQVNCKNEVRLYMHLLSNYIKIKGKFHNKSCYIILTIELHFIISCICKAGRLDIF